MVAGRWIDRPRLAADGGSGAGAGGRGVFFFLAMRSGALTFHQHRAHSGGPLSQGGVPDGMTIDADGNLWVVLGESGCVAQYDAGTGAEMRRVQLPVQRPTACTFGGDDLAVRPGTATKHSRPRPAATPHAAHFRIST